VNKNLFMIFYSQISINQCGSLWRNQNLMASNQAKSGIIKKKKSIKLICNKSIDERELQGPNICLT